MTTYAEIKDDFAFMDDWEERFSYVIELAKGLEALPAEAQNDANKVRGCASQVWLSTRVSEDEPRRLTFVGDSDSVLVKGLIAVLLSLYNGLTPEEALAVDAHARLAELGLNEHLTPQRSNGLKSMVERVRSDAAALVQT